MVYCKNAKSSAEAKYNVNIKTRYIIGLTIIFV